MFDTSIIILKIKESEPSKSVFQILYVCYHEMVWILLKQKFTIEINKKKNYGGRRKIYNTYYNKWIHQVMQILIETASKFAFRFDGGHFDQSQKVPSSIGIF